MHRKGRSIYNGRCLYVNCIQPGRFYKKSKKVIRERVYGVLAFSRKYYGESLSGAAARTGVERKNE